MNSISKSIELPLPPVEMRQLIGTSDLTIFNNPSGNLIFDFIPPEAYESVFDFGCGCGRNARKLLQQKIVPPKYVGIDLHPVMIDWCQKNLTPYANNFHFYHHDVFQASFNPSATKHFDVFPSPDSEFSLIIAHSVFTHLIEDVIIDYLSECSRIMRPDAYLWSTWFLFDKKFFPMMQIEQNSLYINLVDPTNAVIYDYQWLFQTAQEIGLTPVYAIKPPIRGFQWSIIFRPSSPELTPCSLPVDDAEFGIMRPPNVPDISSLQY